MTTVLNRTGFSQLVLSLFFVINCTAQTTGFSGSGVNIDVIYYRCEWRINPDSVSKGIKGAVTVYFVTVDDNISQISLDLNKTSFNNVALSVYYHGAPVSSSFPSTGNVHLIRINLPVTLPLNTTDSLTINYEGVPPAVSGQAEGYQKKSSAGYNYIYTLSESYEDKDWWPCKADMQDKPDSMDIFINVPSAFSAVSLGQLVDSASNGANQVFHWKTTTPVATYLVAVSVARYRVYDRGTVNISGTSVPVWYFLFPGKSAGTYTSILTTLDHSMAELTAFSSVFGDKVTSSTWNHLWLADGFARYAEALAAELVPALGQNPVTVSFAPFQIRTSGLTSSIYGYCGTGRQTCLQQAAVCQPYTVKYKSE